MLETALEEILLKDKMTRRIFGGVLAFDELPKSVNYPSCFIFNTKPRSHEGEHWLAVFFDENKIGYFFDSYGQKPEKYGFDSFLKKNSKRFYFNEKRIQGFSEYCGYYSALYLLFKANSISFKFFKIFNKNFLLNDKKLFQTIKKFSI